jgi:glycosyltransferase involved in cell wall biosynthesis
MSLGDAGVESESSSGRRPCRVALFVPNLDGGGAERVVVGLANQWNRSGLLVDLVLQKAMGPYLKDVDAGVRIVDLRARRLIFSVLPLIRYLRKTKPDAVLSTPSSANIIALLARSGARVGTRVVVREAITPTADDAVSPGIRAAVIARLRKLVYRQAFRVIAPSIGAAEDLATNVGVPRESITVIPNPLDTARIRMLASESVEDPRLLACGKLVLAAGRLATQKDFATLIRAFEQLKTRGAILVVLGEGSERSALTKLAADLGISDRVILAGFQENPYAYMKKAAVFVLSSRYEGMPNVLLEAAFAGTNVVATDCPSGPREILEGGRWGRLVPVGDVGKMAEAIDDALTGRLEKPSSAIIEQRYGVDTIARRYLNVLMPGIDRNDCGGDSRIHG